MISKENCKDRYLYRIHSRNLAFGVFRASTAGFIGLRTKFGSVFMFEEYHWDNGPPYGTVRPDELLEELPAGIELKLSLGTVCGTCGKRCDYSKFPDGPRERTFTNDSGKPYTMNVPGEWIHTESTVCDKIIPNDIANSALKQWLKRMENKYEIRS